MLYISINEFIKRFEENDRDFLYKECFGFCDWFCASRSLERRAKSLIPKLKFLVKQGIINGDTTQVAFKNNYSLRGDTYDDMRFTVIENNKYLGLVAPTLGHRVGDLGNKCLVVARREAGDYDMYTMEFDSWRNCQNSIKDDVHLRDKLAAHFYH